MSYDVYGMAFIWTNTTTSGGHHHHPDPVMFCPTRPWFPPNINPPYSFTLSYIIYFRDRIRACSLGTDTHGCIYMFSTILCCLSPLSAQISHQKPVYICNAFENNYLYFVIAGNIRLQIHHYNVFIWHHHMVITCASPQVSRQIKWFPCDHDQPYTPYPHKVLLFKTGLRGAISGLPLVSCRKKSTVQCQNVCM